MDITHREKPSSHGSDVSEVRIINNVPSLTRHSTGTLKFLKSYSTVLRYLVYSTSYIDKINECTTHNPHQRFGLSYYGSTQVLWDAQTLPGYDVPGTGYKDLRSVCVYVPRVYKIEGYLTQRRQHGFSIVSTILMLDTNAGTSI